VKILGRLVNIGLGFGALVLANWLGWISFLKDGRPTNDVKTIVAGLVIMFLLSLVIDALMGWAAARWLERRDRRRLNPPSASTLYLIGFLGTFVSAFALLVGMHFAAPGFLALNANWLLVLATAGLMSLDLPED